MGRKQYAPPPVSLKPYGQEKALGTCAGLKKAVSLHACSKAVILTAYSRWHEMCTSPCGENRKE